MANRGGAARWLFEDEEAGGDSGIEAGGGFVSARGGRGERHGACSFLLVRTTLCPLPASPTPTRQALAPSPVGLRGVPPDQRHGRKVSRSAARQVTESVIESYWQQPPPTSSSM